MSGHAGRRAPRPNYGRKRRVRADGYVSVWRPDHPLATRDGYVLEHRLVAWDAGLLTDPALQVHHRNGDKADNSIENLEVLSRADHTRRHAAERTPTKCPHGHAYTPENTAFLPSGWRYCKQCNRDRAAARKRRPVAELEPCVRAAMRGDRA